METQTGSWLLAVLLLVMLNSAPAEDRSVYFVVFGSLVLRPPVAPERISQILWKYDSNVLAEWEDGRAELGYYGTFKDRAELNTTTACLEVRNMSEADAGMYSVEINDKLQRDRYDAKVIQKVPKPVILVQPLMCSSASDSCSLTCEGNITEAEPVTYSWRMGDGDWKESEKSINISNTEEILSVKTFSCQMKNPVSEEESGPRINPFLRRRNPNSRRWVGVLLTVLKVLGIISLVSAIVYMVWRNRETACPCIGGKGENAAQSR